MSALGFLTCVAVGCLLAYLIYEIRVFFISRRADRAARKSSHDYWGKLIGPDTAKGPRHLRVTREEDHD